MYPLEKENTMRKIRRYKSMNSSNSKGDNKVTVASDNHFNNNCSFTQEIHKLLTSNKHTEELREATFMSDKDFYDKYPKETQKFIALARDTKRRELVMEKIKEHSANDPIRTFREMSKTELQKFMDK